MGRAIGNVNSLKNEILKQAKEQGEASVERARRVAERDVFYAKDEAESIKAAKQDKIYPMLEIERRKATASAEIEARKILLEKKDELVSRAFDEGQKELEAMRGTQAYIDIINGLIEKGISAIREDVIVQFGEKDEYLFTSEFIASIRSHVIKSLGKGIRVQFECAGDEISSGVIIKSINGKMIVDNSFSGLFRRLKKEFRGKVSEMLLQS